MCDGQWSPVNGTLCFCRCNGLFGTLLISNGLSCNFRWFLTFTAPPRVAMLVSPGKVVNRGGEWQETRDCEHCIPACLNPLWIFLWWMEWRSGRVARVGSGGWGAWAWGALWNETRTVTAELWMHGRDGMVLQTGTRAALG
eukprot:gene15784-biopygen11254